MAPASLRPLLVELFVEELPPKALPRLAAAFGDGIAAGLRQEGLAGADSSDVTTFATPRRLAVRIDGVGARAADRPVSHKLMPASVGLSAAGTATPALLKKLAALGSDESAVPRLERRVDGKSETLFLDAVVAGASLADGLQRALDRALAQLPIPKLMQYQLADGWTSVSFVRPAHALVALHGDEVVPVRALGLDAGRTTQGHRFEGRRAPIVVRDATSYETQLRDEGAVIASFAERRAEILRQLQAAAAAAGLAPIDDDALLDEVTALVELPNVLACRFDAEFLAVPPECLVLTMKANQKYFPLLDAAGALTNRFLVVSNIAPADPVRIVEGNERVVRPRLADAKFFYDQDRKRTLESRVPGLDKVVYHGKLGSQGDRVRRVRAIAAWVAERIGADRARAERAALLAKADLLTDMVGEFPELQGIMGGYYAAHDGEAPDVAAAIRGQYVNRRGEGDDAAPTNLVGEALLIADRAEALVGIWGIGLKPTGDKDPYALRRHALTLIDSFQRVAANRIVARAGAARAARACRVDIHRAARGRRGRRGRELRLRALLPAAGGALRDARRRCRHRPAAGAARRRRPPARGPRVPRPARSACARRRQQARRQHPEEERRRRGGGRSGPAERAGRAGARWRARRRRRRGRPRLRRGRVRSLTAPSRRPEAVGRCLLRHVMVNVDSPSLRANRLALLAALRTTMNRVADLSRLAV